MEEKVIGKITHHFPKLSVGVIELSAPLKKGQKVHIKGGTTDFEQVINSMQVDREEIDEAKAGDEIGVKFNEKVRGNDVVYSVE